MDPSRARPADWLKSLPFYLLPHHALSRVVFAASRLRGPLCLPLMRWFVRRYRVNLEEALIGDLREYPSFNALFTRALRPGAREIVSEPGTVASPVDGTVSQLGTVGAGRILQAKGRHYSVYELLGGSKQRAAPFLNGRYATLYLSPRDYHRVHMPVDARLREMVHIPGRLFSVAPHTTRTIPKLFARNERLVCLFDSELGPMAMVLVGAVNVAAIETVWAGLVTPPRGRQISVTRYDDTPLHLHRGQEMGRFNLGSTVILLFADTGIEWVEGLAAGSPVRLGQCLARHRRPPETASPALSP